MKNNILDVAVIGAGQAGLSVSYLLKKHQLHHIVFEKGQIGNSWKSQRWDSFRMNSPNQYNLLPDESLEDLHPEGFITADQFATRLSTYATSYDLPVLQQSKVTALEKDPDGQHYTIQIQQNGQSHSWKSRQVVVAAGAQTHPKLPELHRMVPRSIFQIHSKDYRNPSQLPEGAVLIVGSATSGVQIAEELLEANRKVFLSTSAAGRLPRRYRGRDIMAWLADMKFFDKPVADAEPFEVDMVAPLMSGIGEFGHTLSLQQLFKQGATLLGYLDGVENYTLLFDTRASDHVRFGDTFSTEVKMGIDQFIQATGIEAPLPEADPADLPDENLECVSDISRLDSLQNQINTIIWTTGFTCDFSWIKLPVLNEKGEPVHSNGISSEKGLYFMGLPWLRNLKSSLIYGTGEDASEITKAIIQNHVT